MDIETLAIAFVLLTIFCTVVAGIVLRIRRRSWKELGLIELLIIIVVVGVTLALLLPPVPVTR